MKIDVLLGLQWGDEGKGKFVDLLSPKYDIIASANGGPNAGHTVEFDGQKIVLHTAPSGSLMPGKINIMGNGKVIDPVQLWNEILEIQQFNPKILDSLYLSETASLILPIHRILDGSDEKSSNAVGSTLRGIGPTYRDKTGRSGLLVGYIFDKDFTQKFHSLTQKHLDQMSVQNRPNYDELNMSNTKWFEAVEWLKSNVKIIDCTDFLNNAIEDGEEVLAEFAQAAMLDIDYGTYPYVTSSHTMCAQTGLGIRPQYIGRSIGVAKAYVTRVGLGPFITKMETEIGEKVRTIGQEFGATTKRPRDCGWLDLVALRYAIRVSGATEIALTKADVFANLGSIKVCTKHLFDGKEIPFSVLNYKNATPYYTEMEGWGDIRGITNKAMFPTQFTDYINMITKCVGVPVKMVSTGPDRNEIVYL